MSGWSVEFVNAAAMAEVAELPSDLQVRFRRIATLIDEFGLENVGQPYVKHLEGKLWEMRMNGRDRIARSIYITAVGKRVVVLRTFIKKKQRTPRREIEAALARAKDVK